MRRILYHPIVSLILSFLMAVLTQEIYLVISCFPDNVICPALNYAWFIIIFLTIVYFLGWRKLIGLDKK